MASSPDEYRELIDVLRTLREALSKIEGRLTADERPSLSLVTEEARDA